MKRLYMAEKYGERNLPEKEKGHMVQGKGTAQKIT